MADHVRPSEFTIIINDVETQQLWRINPKGAIPEIIGNTLKYYTDAPAYAHPTGLRGPQSRYPGLWDVGRVRPVARITQDRLDKVPLAAGEPAYLRMDFGV